MDLPRNENDGALIQRFPDLYIKQLNIILAEKQNQLKQLDVRLDHIMTVEVKQIELKKDTLQKEILSLQTEISRKSAIEIKTEN
jgi:hypothetical protein